MSDGIGIGLGDQGDGDTFTPTEPDIPTKRVDFVEPKPPVVEPDGGEAEPGSAGEGQTGSGGGTRVPGLAELLVILLLIALAGALKSLADFFNWLFRKFLGPLWSSAGKPSVDPATLGQGLTSTFSGTFQGSDATIGSAFHQLANDLARLGSVLSAATQAILTLSRRLVGLEQRVGAEHAQNAATRQAVAQQGKAQQRSEHQAAQQQATQITVEQTQQAQLRALVEHVHHVIEPELDQQRKQIGTLKRGHLSLWGEIEKHGEQIGIDGLVAGVGVAAGVLGMSWTRCDNNQRLGEGYCQMPSNLMKDILAALSVVGLGAFTLVALAEWEKTIVHTIEGAVVGFWAAVAEDAGRNPYLGQSGL